MSAGTKRTTSVAAAAAASADSAPIIPHPLPEALDVDSAQGVQKSSCPICMEVYDSSNNGGGQVTASHLPLVLQCGHCLCGS